jgi:hypothetical protein
MWKLFAQGLVHAEGKMLFNTLDAIYVQYQISSCNRSGGLGITTVTRKEQLMKIRVHVYELLCAGICLSEALVFSGASLNIFLFFIFLEIFFPCYIQHCFICRPSDSTVPTDAGIEPRTVATGALAVRRSNH